MKVRAREVKLPEVKLPDPPEAPRSKDLTDIKSFLEGQSEFNGQIVLQLNDISKHARAAAAIPDGFAEAWEFEVTERDANGFLKRATLTKRR